MKLNQIIAVSSNVKSRKQSSFSEVYHMLGKEGVFSGHSKTYLPKDEDGEKLPDEVKVVQLTIDKAIEKAKAVLEDMFNVVATQDSGNCFAKADVKIDDKVILKDVPATNLIFLEKQLDDISTFISKFPTLDPAENWTWNTSGSCFKTEESETFRTKQQPKSMITAPATDKHPAQVHIYNENVVIGTYKQVKFSGAIESTKKEALAEKVRILTRAVQQAREEANMTEVVSVTYGTDILKYIFG